MKNPIKTFEANTEGRDFVIGDLHGAYTVLENLLKNLNFDKTKDRLFSVGDLVDRGPKSLKCLELLYEPWFHAVLANHEQMMVEAFDGGYMGNFWLGNGGMWGAEALNTWRINQSSGSISQIPTDDEATLYDLLDKVRELPFLTTVSKRNGEKVHIIHAELPPNRTITDADLEDPEKVLEYASVQSRDGDFLVWGRHLYYSFYAMDLSNTDKVKRSVAYNFGRNMTFNENLSHIISGHTVVQKPFTIVGQTNLDTCAYGSYGVDAKRWMSLTCLDINDWKFYQATATEFREIEPMVVTQEDVERLRHVVRPEG